METPVEQTLASDPAELFNFLSFMTDDQRPYFYRVSSSLRMFLGSFCLLVLAWGTLMRSFVYNHFSNIKLTERPINIYLLFDIILFHCTNTFFVLHYTSIIFTGETSVIFIGHLFGLNVNLHSYCSVFSNIGLFALAYSSSGSCGLAVFRMFCVRSTNWVKFRIGEYRLLTFLVVFSVILSVGMTVMFTSGESTGRSVNNTCMGRSQIVQVFQTSYGTYITL